MPLNEVGSCVVFVVVPLPPPFGPKCGRIFGRRGANRQTLALGLSENGRIAIVMLVKYFAQHQKQQQLRKESLTFPRWLCLRCD